MPIATVVDLLSCPHCRSVLTTAEDGRGVRCAQGHRFDLARQGYLNLLAGPQPANADTPAMIEARDRLLGAGTFEPIVAAAVRAAAPPPGARVLDAGAGTGALLAHLVAAADDSRGIALDVSTAAARRAARAHPRVGAVVADVWRPLPVADAAVDLVVSNFAPRNVPEFARVVAPGGALVTITPTADHLVELRRTYGLLDIPADKAERLAGTLAADFESDGVERVEFHSTWSAVLIADAMAMGPNAFHADSGARPARPAVAPGPVTSSVEVRRWTRRR